MFCEEKFSEDLLDGFVERYYEVIREIHLPNGISSGKTYFIDFLNIIFNTDVKYALLTKEKVQNAVYNGKRIYKKFRDMQRNRRKEEMADVDWGQFIGKYYYSKSDDGYDFFRVDRALTHKLGITHYLMNLEWSDSCDMEVYKVELYGEEPRAICDSVVDKVKFYFEMDKLEVVDFETFEGQKN